jgi:DNA-3-methyladenine glycosylase II
MKPTPRELRALARRDPRLGAWLRRLPPYPGFPDEKNPRQRGHYDALASAIVYQQLSGKAAETIWRRIAALTPGRHFPRHDELLRLEDEALRGAGLSRAKLAALRDLCTRIDCGSLGLRDLARRTDEEIVERLVEVRGIGVWSAQMFLMFRLGRLDVMAPGDLGLQEGLRILDGLEERPTPAEVEQRTAIWSPLRSVGAWTLWRLVEHERAEKHARALPAPRTRRPRTSPAKRHPR